MIHRWTAVLILAAIALGSGCTHRTITIESDPPGARVFVDLHEVGTTPVTIDFTYGGTRTFLLLHEDDRDGVVYKPARVTQQIENFYLDTFPFDLFAALSPIEIRDDQFVSVRLEPSTIGETFEADPDAYVDAILGRADSLRTRARELQLHSPPPVPPLLPPAKSGEEADEKSSDANDKKKGTDG